MAAKVLLGVVALAAIVGSPIAYSHFNSPVVETQQEERREDQQQDRQQDRQLTASSRPEAPQIPPVPPAKGPELQAQPEPREKNKVNEDSSSDDVKAPKQNDKCGLEGKDSWTEVGSLSPEMQCVRRITESTRTSH